MSEQAPRHRAAHTGLTIIAASVTMLIVVAMFAAMLIAKPFSGLTDHVGAQGTTVSQTVSQLQSTEYCPAMMSLADNGSFGDSEFRVSAGNITSTARYAAFGSVYRSTVNTLAGTADDTALAGSDQDSDVLTASGSVNDASTLVTTRLLESKSGTGLAAAVASRATDGDLKGVSAASCISPALDHAFLLPDTKTGTTQQLVIANPSNKATTVQVRAWGTEHGGRLNLSTSEGITVKAAGETTVDLSAAAPNQKGLYVTVTSKQTPVAAIVRTVAVDGLTSAGSEYATPLAAAGTSAVIPAVTGGEQTTLFAFATKRSTATLSWITRKGLVAIGQKTIEDGKVTVIDLGKAPDGALAVASTSDEPVSAMVRTTRTGQDGQRDFALASASATSTASGIAIPDGMNATITVANTGSEHATGTIKAYDEAGSLVGQHDIDLSKNTATSLDATDIARNAVILRLDVSGGDLTWGATLSSPDVDDAKYAGIAYLPASALDAVTEQIWASQNPFIVR